MPVQKLRLDYSPIENINFYNKISHMFLHISWEYMIVQLSKIVSYTALERERASKREREQETERETFIRL